MHSQCRWSALPGQACAAVSAWEVSVPTNQAGRGINSLPSQAQYAQAALEQMHRLQSSPSELSSCCGRQDHGLLQQVAHGLRRLPASAEPLLDVGRVQAGLLAEGIVPAQVLQRQQARRRRAAWGCWCRGAPLSAHRGGRAPAAPCRPCGCGSRWPPGGRRAAVSCQTAGSAAAHAHRQGLSRPAQTGCWALRHGLANGWRTATLHCTSSWPGRAWALKLCRGTRVHQMSAPGPGQHGSPPAGSPAGRCVRGPIWLRGCRAGRPPAGPRVRAGTASASASRWLCAARTCLSRAQHSQHEVVLGLRQLKI